MAHSAKFAVAVAFALFAAFADARLTPSQLDGAFAKDTTRENKGTNWALLIAGSAGWGNYRHQADIYHAYQILKQYGMSDDNIVVMHYDDIAMNSRNPAQGTVINKPDGSDVYGGVPKDYVGSDVNAKNFLYVLKGDAEAMKGTASGKVIASGEDDNVFVYFADHGGPGILGMPARPYLYANDLNDVLKEKAQNNGFNKMTIYVEACESGSIFDGLLPSDLNIYVMTASDPDESSWGTYCPGMTPAPPASYRTCLGDLFSVAWMEDSDAHDLSVETLGEQYVTVKNRTSNGGTYRQGSHVMQYGTTSWTSTDVVADFVGARSRSRASNGGLRAALLGEAAHTSGIAQHEIDLHVLWHAYAEAEHGTDRKSEAWSEFRAEVMMRERADKSVSGVVEDVIRSNTNSLPSAAVETGKRILSSKKAKGEALVRDWECFKASFEAFLGACGPFESQYVMKHSRAFANLCDEGFSADVVRAAAERTCVAHA